jgi:lipoprotein-anchoring transpeptidase ErfK/SrfK
LSSRLCIFSSYAIGIPPKKCAGAGNGNTEPSLSAPKARLLTLVVVAVAAQLVGCASTGRHADHNQLAVASTTTAPATDDVWQYMAKTPDLQRYRLVLSISEQKLALLDRHSVVAVYPVSTSIKSPSEATNSGGTPRGLHVISEKIGAGLPEGMIIKGREPIGIISELDPGGDPPVVTRLFRLRGLESTNQSTHERLIYLHGSPHEKLLGQPASGGCIRMSSRDVIALFDAIEVGTPISLLEQDLSNAIAATLEREERFAALRNSLEQQLQKRKLETKSAHSLCIGHMYGINGTPQNYPAAKNWCEISAKLGSVSAVTLLAELQEFGSLAPANMEAARILYEHAAARGHKFAAQKLAALRASGKNGPVPVP